MTLIIRYKQVHDSMNLSVVNIHTSKDDLKEFFKFKRIKPK